MKQPLHHPYYSPDSYADLKRQLRERAQLAFLNTQLGAALARKSKTSRASVNGFRSARRNDPMDLTYCELALVAAGMMPRPTRFSQSEEAVKARDEKKLANDIYLARVRASKGFNNWQQFHRYRRGDCLLPITV